MNNYYNSFKHTQHKIQILNRKVVLICFSSKIVHVHVHHHHHDHVGVGIVVVIIIVVVVIVVVVVVLAVDCRDDGVDGEDGGRHHVEHVERIFGMQLTRGSSFYYKIKFSATIDKSFKIPSFTDELIRFVFSTKYFKF